jgi:hypothetical protein
MYARATQLPAHQRELDLILMSPMWHAPPSPSLR